MSLQDIEPGLGQARSGHMEGTRREARAQNPLLGVDPDHAFVEYPARPQGHAAGQGRDFLARKGALDDERVRI